MTLLCSYTELDKPPLGYGHVHGDAYPGNLFDSVDAPLLADWEETATGPRELDLANMFQDVRFGRTVPNLDACAEAYGRDPHTWTGLATLTAVRDLHKLGLYVRRSERGAVRARAERAWRMASLRRGDTAARWSAA